MASSGPNSPTTVVSSDEIEAGGLTWTNPGNAVSSNNTYASMAGVTDETIEDYLKATGFGFSIPDGTIDGIVVEIDGRAVGGDTTACNTSAALVINGLINANYAKPGATWVPDAGESTLTFGTSSDDWDGGVATQLTPADINDADFGVAFTANTANAATTFEVDHIRITVHYTPAASGPTVQATNVLATNVTASTATLSWTRGDGDKVVVFVASAGTGENIAGSLVDTTTYTANTAFGSGTLVSEDGVNWYCVYNGTGTTVNITNLTSGSQYTAVACEYDGTAGAEVYMDDTATGNPVDFSTIAIQMFSSRRRNRRRGKKK